MSLNTAEDVHKAIETFAKEAWAAYNEGVLQRQASAPQEDSARAGAIAILTKAMGENQTLFVTREEEAKLGDQFALYIVRTDVGTHITKLKHQRSEPRVALQQPDTPSRN
jgi:hypothetical protein